MLLPLIRGGVTGSSVWCLYGDEEHVTGAAGAPAGGRTGANARGQEAGGGRCPQGPLRLFQSSLLRALLGELPPSQGKVNVHGRIAYVSQQPWVFPGTVRSNILFGTTDTL